MLGHRWSKKNEMSGSQFANEIRPGMLGFQ